LLSRALVEQVKRIGVAVRRGEVTPLVGPGMSVRAGIPAWNTLVERIIRAWQLWDPSPAARRLSPDNCVNLDYHNFRIKRRHMVQHCRCLNDELLAALAVVG
jgi:hypothetical protein